MFWHGMIEIPRLRLLSQNVDMMTDELGLVDAIQVEHVAWARGSLASLVRAKWLVEKNKQRRLHARGKMSMSVENLF